MDKAWNVSLLSQIMEDTITSHTTQNRRHKQRYSIIKYTQFMICACTRDAQEANSSNLYNYSLSISLCISSSIICSSRQSCTVLTGNHSDAIHGPIILYCGITNQMYHANKCIMANHTIANVSLQFTRHVTYMNEIEQTLWKQHIDHVFNGVRKL
eukprot:105921_1